MTQGPYPPNYPGNGYPGQQPGYPGQQPGYPAQRPGPGQQPGYPAPSGQQPGYPAQPAPAQPSPPQGYPDQQNPGYPDQQVGYPDQQSPQGGGYPVSPAPGYATPVTAVPAGQPVTGIPGGPQQPYPVAEPPRKSRKMLYSMISVCTVLALAFGTTAYFMFFSGDAPPDVVSEFIGHAVDGDYDQARGLACEDATEGVKFQGNAEDMDTMRRWFEGMEWKIREDSTSGKKSTVIVDKTLNSFNYPKPVPMRWDYKLQRESGGWCIMSAKIMSVVPTNIGDAGDCVEAKGFLYESADCGLEGEDIYKISDVVPTPTDCPNQKGAFAENEDRMILCLDENYHY